MLISGVQQELENNLPNAPQYRKGKDTYPFCNRKKTYANKLLQAMYSQQTAVASLRNNCIQVWVVHSHKIYDVYGCQNSTNKQKASLRYHDRSVFQEATWFVKMSKKECDIEVMDSSLMEFQGKQKASIRKEELGQNKCRQQYKLGHGWPEKELWWTGRKNMLQHEGLLKPGLCSKSVASCWKKVSTSYTQHS